jgi:formate--tetrahydrofolate ligase
MRLGDYAVTEAGFGFDLGGEKFLDIKCRGAGFWPRLVVVVASRRALALHGIENLEKHLESAAAFGLTPIVALNAFASDAPDELSAIERALAARGVACVTCRGYERGGEGAIDLARAVCDAAEATDASPPAPRFLYALDAPFEDKARAVARAVYGARDVVLTGDAAADIARANAMGASSVPVCFAKTHLALSDDPAAVGRPRDFDVVVREVRANAGAGMLVALTGAVTTMPGLPRDPAARRIRLLPDGRVAGLGT